jgi:hypothetical protein
MTSLLNSSYTQINDLISINSDDIQSESISTNNLIISGSNISTSLTNLQSQITTLQGQVDGLLLVFSNTGMYYNSTLNAFFISLSDLRVTKNFIFI